MMYCSLSGAVRRPVDQFLAGQLEHLLLEGSDQVHLQVMVGNSAGSAASQSSAVAVTWIQVADGCKGSVIDMASLPPRSGVARAVPSQVLG
jgi:hypothetical protein